MGSQSDWATMIHTSETLTELGIGHECRVVSAHRTPDLLFDYADSAEQRGDLSPGGTIVEPTSGNTGVGLALVAQQRGYKCVFVCPDKVSQDKQNVLRAYGAEVIECPTAVEPDDPRSYYSVSDRLLFVSLQLHCRRCCS